MDYYRELIDMGVDPERIDNANGDYKALYAAVVKECSDFAARTVTVLTGANNEYSLSPDDVTVKQNGLLIVAEEGLFFLPWSNIKVVGYECDDADVLRDFFYNF